MQKKSSQFRHQGKHIKSIVYGGLDGTITTFAIVAGVAGASLSSRVLLILGFANLIADGISMAVGDYLSSRAEKDYQKATNKHRKPDKENIPVHNAGYTFLSFIIFGFIPLLTYVIALKISSLLQYQLEFASALTAITLICLGAMKSTLTNKHWLKSSIETLFVGGLAALAAYLVGYLLATLV